MKNPASFSLTSEAFQHKLFKCPDPKVLSTERENMRGWEGGKNQWALKTNFMNSNQAGDTSFDDTIQTWRKTDYICYLSGRASAAQGRTYKV